LSTPTSNEGSVVELSWRLGIRVVLLFALVLVAYLDWFYVRAERWDTPPLIPVLLLSEFPALLALLLVVTRRQLKAFACGSGIAFGLGTVLLLLAPLLLFSVGFAIWDTGTVYHNLVQLRKALPAVFLTGVLLLAVSWRPGRGRRLHFFIGCAALLFYVAFAFESFARWTIPGTGHQKEETAWAKPPDEAFHAAISIAGCLIQHASSSPGAAFPSSLTKVPSDWGCDSQYMKPQPVQDYILTYAPQVDLGSQKATDFRLTLIPFDQGVPLMIDRRGILFKCVEGHGAAGPGSPAIHAWGGNYLPWLQKFARQFSDEHRRAPTSFAEFYSTADLAPGYGPRKFEAGGMIYRHTIFYADRYFPPPLTAPGSYAMSSTCDDYGRSCIRSYFLDYDGVMHGTSEQRTATAQDPVLLPCEVDWKLSCSEANWVVPDPLTEKQIQSASLQHLLSTTILWLPAVRPEVITSQLQAQRYAQFAKAQQSMDSIAACLIRGQATHHEHGFPSSLQTIPSDWNCNVQYPDPIPGYRASYQPQQDSASADATGFRLEGVPSKKGMYPFDPILIDQRGILFIYYAWNALPKLVPEIRVFPDIGASKLLGLKLAIEDFMKRNDGKPPVSFAALVDKPQGIQRWEIADSTALVLNESPYSVRYLALTTARPDSFAISATCSKYGDGCIRSYLLDFDGFIYGTAEPRPATSNDPVVTHCELYGSHCDDEARWTRP
jgi:hypothetical protein